MSGKGEAERLENQHLVFGLMFDQRLIFASMTRVRNVLDCGYGTASWAIEVAEAYPDCEVRSSACCPASSKLINKIGYWCRHLSAYEAGRYTREFLAGGMYLYHIESCKRRSSTHCDFGAALSMAILSDINQI